MPRQPLEDDLFRESTMTFGQHLEALRSCLFKAVVGLAIGFVLGLSVGRYIVEFIESPLSRALKEYYDMESIDRLQAEETPWTKKDAKQVVETDGLFVEETYIDPAQLIPQLKTKFPEQLGNLTWLPPQAAKPTEKSTEPANQADSAEASAGSKEGTPELKKKGKESLIRMLLFRPSKDDQRTQIKSMGTQEPFMVYIKASLLAGVLGASPWIFYQIWSFVAAGLYPHERRYVHMYAPFSFGLFLAGAALAFFVVFKPVLGFLLQFNRMLGIDPIPRLSEWMSLVMILPVGFGIGFQLPLVMLFLERIGVFTVKSYTRQWRIAVLVIFGTAALLTPPDPYSMTLMACPLTLLYFGGILLCKLWPRHESPFAMTTTK